MSTTVTSAHPRLSLNQATIKYASLADALRVTAAAGIGSIGLWREPVADVGLDEAVRLVADSGLRVSSLCRGGFFTPLPGAARNAALDDNRRAIDETAALAAAGAEGSRAVLVLVAGGLPAGSRDLIGARERVRDAVGVLEADAASAGVTLAIEPLHPMYAADRAVISTLGQALDIAEQFNATTSSGPTVAVEVDTFHIWWDPQVLEQIARAGRTGRIASYQVCDWITPLPADVLLGRGMMGDGHIDFGPMTDAVERAGYTGDVEVEIFNQQIWDAPFDQVATRVVASFAEHVAVALPAGLSQSA
ncbi:MAG TPA: sugar phosphate isomerase/epimerase family protein [Microbacteriaceae bacterium]|nr:sugar phosphate isomerase/epimerase family protein [Microbacteriaceae bacterium]